jgi:simple sugar transport system permease protein
MPTNAHSLILALTFTTLALATPLLLAALGELIGERAGVLNIGLEGMMLVGAWAGAAASFKSGHALAGLLAAIAAGTLLAAAFGLLALTLQADAIVVGTGLNLFALGLTGMLHRAMAASFGDYTAVTLPQWVFNVLGACLVPLLWAAFRYTRTGIQIRAVGEYPPAADAAGVNVGRVRWFCTLANGALCGAAGAFLAMSHTNAFNENMTSGRGFIALAIVIFGRWSPWGALGAALLFGAAEGMQFFLQTTVSTTYYPLLLTLPYLLTLLTLAGKFGTTTAPAALAQRYERE